MKRLFVILLLCIATPLFSGSEETEGGIQGTGANPVGVFGTVTKLGSIYVNGIRVTYDANARVNSPIGSFAANRLRPGDTVALEVVAKGKNFRAVRISDAPALIGPVQNGKVLGVPVAGAKAYTDGEWLLVSGLWAQKGLDVTRIRKIAPQEFTLVQGDYRPARRQVGDVRLGNVTLKHARPFETLRVYMTLDGQIQRVQKGLFSPSITRTLIEGYLTNPLVTGEYTVRGGDIVAYAKGGGEMPTLRNFYCATLGGAFGTVEIIGNTPGDALGCLLRKD